MGLMKFLFRNKTDKNIPWEETKRGKEFSEKMRVEAEERARKNAEWENTVPPERKEQYKLFKIFFTIFFGLFVALLWFGFYTKLALIFLGGECLIAALSLVLFFVKPKFVKYPNCFMMPVIAFGCSALFFIYLGVQFGFDSSFDKNMFVKNKTETVITEDVSGGLENTEEISNSENLESEEQKSENRSNNGR